MKKYPLILSLFLLFFFGSISAFAQLKTNADNNQKTDCTGTLHLNLEPNWVNLNSGFTTSLNTVFFVNSNTGYSIIGLSSIMKTVDGGNNWTKKIITSTTLKNSLYFTSETTGYMAGSAGTILKTQDGGDNWTQLTSGTTSILYSMYFTSSEVGYAVGTSGTIIKTSDGGTSWTKQSSGTSSRLRSIRFIDVDNGYAVGDAGTILKTNNGGITWTSTIISPDLSFGSVFFTDTNTGYATSNSSYGISFIYKTTDSGSNWEGIQCPIPTVNSICFSSAQTGYIAGGVGNTYMIFRTIDGGMSWDPQVMETPSVINSASYAFNAICFTDSLTGFAVGTAGKIMKFTKDKTITCGGTTQFNNATANYTGTGVLKYKWTPSTGLNNDSILNPTVSVTSDITYTLTVTTPGGCTATDNIGVTINPFKVNGGYSTTVPCGGTTIFADILTTNYSGTGVLRYKWTPSTGLNNDSILHPTATVSNDITYTLIATTPNGCTASNKVSITVIPIKADAGADKTVVCGGTVQLSSISTDYTGTGKLKYKWTPSTGLNNDSIANPTSTGTSDITYTATVTSPNGCTASDNVSVMIVPMDKPEIGMVGISSNGNKNLIAWNKPISAGIESFYVYRETNVSNVYEKIGTVPYDSLSVFVDNQSLPDVQSNKYTLSILDRHGLESPQSNAHKTMHLAINKGIGAAWNLSWEAYEGFVVPTYNIYRGTNPANFTLIASTSGSNTQYNDLNAPLGNIYYQLEVISPKSVNPTKTLSSQKTKAEENVFSNSEISYSSSRSNIATNVISAINETEVNDGVNIYPNPASAYFSVYGLKEKTKLSLFNLNGQLLLSKPVNNAETVSVGDLPKGLYIVRISNSNSSTDRKLIKK